MGEREEQIRWVTFTGDPSRLIPLQSALGQVVEEESGVGLVDFDVKWDWCDPARREFYNVFFGGRFGELDAKRFVDRFTKRAEMPKPLKAELAMAEGTHTAAWARARSKTKKHLAAGEFWLIRVAKRSPCEPVGPVATERCVRNFWQSRDRDDRVLQQMILERGEHFDGKWWYALLIGDEHTKCVAAGAPDIGNPDVPSDIVVDEMADWIFAKHPRKRGEPPQRYIDLRDEAQKRDWSTAFKEASFKEAYRKVYQSENHKPPKSGWPLRDSYKNRLDSESEPGK
jgi:hypothetical protein